MMFLQKGLNVFLTLSLMASCASTAEQAPQQSFWGKVANLNLGCSHWRLKPQVSIPALQELTICFNLMFEVWPSSPWMAFMYRHPEVQYAELGLGGKWGRLVVYLFGTEWTTPHIDLHLAHWHSLCLTWTHSKDRPALYVNGELQDIMAETAPSTTPSLFELAPNGTLTLGASHVLANGNIEIIPFTALLGKLSLFRLWGRERGAQEVTSLYCTEGDLVKWERDNWDTQFCPPLPDPSLKCQWSIYEVTLMFVILRYDGNNNTELYTARDIAQNWLSEVLLPTGIHLHTVSVFEVTRSSTEDRPLNFSHEDQLVRWSPANKRFNCLVQVSVIPSKDVKAVQNDITMYLKTPYLEPDGLLQLLANPESIHTSPIESFSSTTTPAATASSFTTSTANISELYFEVKVNVTITGDCDPEHTLSTWLNATLPDDTMMVIELQLLPKVQRHHLILPSNLSTADGVSVYRVSRVSCTFQVRVRMSVSDTQEIKLQIRNLLLMPYNGSISIATGEDVHISRILIIQCKAETCLTRKGLFDWPTISGGTNATLPCPRNPDHHATRHCKMGLNTHWNVPDLEYCFLVVETIPDLDHIKVTAGNALDVVAMIQGLLRNHSTLSYHELVTVLNKLKHIVNLSVIKPHVGQALINILSNILESNSNLLPFTNTILNITEAVGDRMVGYVCNSTLVAPSIAISVVDIVPGEFASLTFGATSDRIGSTPEIYINTLPLNSTVAFLSLPSALQYSFPQNSQFPPRVTFQFFGIPMLFRGSKKGRTLNTFVVSASVTNASAPIKDLGEDVKITLHHLTPNKLYKDVQCVYWNFNKNNGDGGWDDYGCRKSNSNSDLTMCLCDHLTHFGVLLDVSRTPVDSAHDQILTIITYVGCGVSSLFLGVTVLTYTAFEKLRRDYPSKILINLSLALLGLNLVFLVNSWLSSWGIYGLCVAAASTLHYFLLASFTWMGLEAVNMYFALVKVFNVYVPSYILKFCALGWGIPLVICVLVLLVNREAYGSHLYTDAQLRLEPLDNSDDFCWLQDDVTFYVSVVAYAVLVLLFNIGVFVVVLIQIRHMRVNSPAGTRSGLMHDLKGVASLTLLLGLTWTVGFFTWGPARIVLLYLFTGLNTLQGLFIFLFHCLMKENVRKQWRIHLCFGPFRLDEYSEWSNSASVGVPAKPRSNTQRLSVPSVHSVKSSSTDSTSASSDSSQRDTSCKRPNLELFVHSLALPRAQKSPSGTGALPPQRGMNPTPGWRNHLLGNEVQR